MLGVTAALVVPAGAPPTFASTLLAPGAVTHSFNMDQRHVGLQIVATGAGIVSLAAPPDLHVAPPGYYTLFRLNAAGVPSIAAFVHLT